MVATNYIKARVTTELKLQIQQASAQELTTESAWLKRLVHRELRGKGAEAALELPEKKVSNWTHVPVTGGRRVYVRLRPDDRLLLEARAAARGVRAATYLSMLTRSHLRGQPPLPKEELVALKRSIAELGALGRNINQIAKAGQGGRLPTSVREEFRAMLKICESLRDSTKALLKSNLASWECGFVQND